MKKYVFLFSSVIVLAVFVEVCQAQMVDYKRMHRRYPAGAKPAAAPAKATPAQPAAQPAVQPAAATAAVPPSAATGHKVVSASERKFDLNKDGILQPAEVNGFLQEVSRIVDGSGGYTVDSDLLKPFDVNKDGLISRYEVKAIKDTIR